MERVFRSRPSAPDEAPAVLGDKLLDRSGEIICLRKHPVEVICSRNLPADLLTLFEELTLELGPFSHFRSPCA
jgi:hypothetical protein